MSNLAKALGPKARSTGSAQSARQFEALSEADKAQSARPYAQKTAESYYSGPESARSTPSQTGPRLVKPANDGPVGFLSGQAPNPELAIVVKPDPIFETHEGDGERWKPRTLELVTANDNDQGQRYLDGDDEPGAVPRISRITEDEFCEFWGIGAWNALSKFSGMFGLDVHEIATEPGEEEDGRAAAACLYKLALKYPRYLGWMLSPSTIIGGDLAIVAFFFGGKMLALMKGMKERASARKALEGTAEAKPPKRSKRKKKSDKVTEMHFPPVNDGSEIVVGGV